MRGLIPTNASLEDPAPTFCDGQEFDPAALTELDPDCWMNAFSGSCHVPLICERLGLLACCGTGMRFGAPTPTAHTPPVTPPCHLTGDSEAQWKGAWEEWGTCAELPSEAEYFGLARAAAEKYDANVSGSCLLLL